MTSKKTSGDVSALSEMEAKVELLQAELEQYKLRDRLMQKRMIIEQVIAKISTDFISLTLDEIQPGIQKALDEILAVSGVDRCSIIEFSTDRKTLTSTFESLKSGIKSTQENLSKISLSDFSWGLSQLEKNDLLYFNAEISVPQDAIGELKLVNNFGLKSFLSIGLKHNGELIGFMAFDSISDYRIWSDEEVLLYKILGQIFANAIVRFQTETKSRENEQKFRALAESSSSGIFITHGGKFTYVNPGAEKMTGYSQSELLNMNFWDFLHPDSAEKAKESGFRRLKGEPVDQNYEVKVLTKRGEIRWLELSAVIIDFNGKKSILGTTFDVTDRKLAEAALLSSENRYKELIQNANDIIYTHDLDGKFTSLNKAGERLLGYSEAEMLEKNVSEIVSPGWLEFAKSMTRKTDSGTETSVYEIEVKAKDGRLLLIELSTRTIFMDHIAVGTQGIGRDITDRRKTERELSTWKTRYEFILESSNQLVFEFNYTRGTTVWGGNLEKVLSYKNGEIGGSEEKWVSLIHPDDRFYVKEAFDVARTHLSSHNIAYRFRKKNGDFIWLRDVGFTRKEQYFGDIVVLGVLQDITATRHAEEEVKKSEIRYRMLFEKNLSGVYRSTLSGEMLDCNDAFVKMLGYESKEEFLRINTKAVYSKDSPRAKFIADLQKNKNLTNYELILQKKDGTTIWALENVSLVESDIYPEPVIEGTIIDITQRKQSEDELAKEKERLSVTLASIGDGVITTDTAGKIILINKSAEHILGIPHLEAIGKSGDEIYCVSDRTTGLNTVSSLRKVLDHPAAVSSNNHLILNSAVSKRKRTRRRLRWARRFLTR